jgi:hypothetical protein
VPVKLTELFAAGGRPRLDRPEDPDAYWDLEVQTNEQIWHNFTDLMYDCAAYLASLPEVTDVPYDGGEVIPICGPISREELELLVSQWWDQAVKADA